MRDFNPKKEVDKISRWLFKYNRQANTCGYVIGLSGGIDSALVANLVTQAVGPIYVTGVIMPIYSPPKDMSDAYKLHSLGIDVVVVDLKPSYDAMVESSGLDLRRLEKANIRARLRMTALYAVAGKQNKLVVGTGNKSEDSIGYFTKYGDGGVDLLPIAEYYKWEVKEMAKYLGIPNELVERVPTAALWEGQTDEDEIGMTYDELDSILYYLETGTLEITDEKIAKVKKMIEKNKHKTEYPPIYRRK